jgi:hypothetical protein
VIDELLERVQRVEVERIARVNDGLDRVEVAPAHEHPQAAEECLEVVVEQVVGPGDRAAQAALARRQVARPPCQEAQARGEPLGDVADL